MIEICRAVVAVHHIDELSQWKKCPNGNADCIATFVFAKFGSTPSPFPLTEMVQISK